MSLSPGEQCSLALTPPRAATHPSGLQRPGCQAGRPLPLGAHARSPPPGRGLCPGSRPRPCSGIAKSSNLRPRATLHAPPPPQSLSLLWAPGAQPAPTCVKHAFVLARPPCPSLSTRAPPSTPAPTPSPSQRVQTVLGSSELPVLPSSEGLPSSACPLGP